MPIKPKTPNAPDKFAKWVTDQLDAKVKGLVAMFTYIGLNAVREMRTRRGYTDRTNNLRSSTAFYVVYNGVVVSGGATPLVDGNRGEGATGGQDGIKAAKEAIEAAKADMSPNSVALVLVAGMKYAYYVERMGLNVTDSAVNLSKREFDSMMVKLGFKKG